MKLVFCSKGLEHAEFHHIIKVTEDAHVVSDFIIIVKSSDFSVILL